MKAVFMIAVVFVSMVLALVAIGGTIFVVIKLIRDGLSPKDQGILSEETRMIQDIYRGMEKMETRVETLETILLDRDHRKEQEL
ncbi:MAG: hypothetical protein B6245_23830 [Desulfobacteraceae bacterium 4572_88]|nr:MAG: hypothetical protein B6245_23830 [Desulfobacteraceae bacterium 4572_88]RLC17810.1 MAG: phage-shock protein [Deltaproteobacteria bacterium]